jgi:shikimate 5-dehydrogenase
LARLSARPEPLVKMAVEVKDFTELQLGHQWWLENPAARVFLPRSKDGRWRWYRSLFGPRMRLHFIREGDGSAPDQPPLWQAVLQPPFQRAFAAVLGHPVEHSRSPCEHLRFFKERGMPFVAVDIEEREFPYALEFLSGLGLTCAAVTAPLKKAAWALAHRVSAEARRAQAANSLFINEKRITAHNTDLPALMDIKSGLPGAGEVWLWGGGGIRGSVKAVWPGAREIPARQGLNGGGADLVIWATGRSRPFRWPASNLRPNLILDLNYGDDSPGLEWAVRENLPYQSGLAMFKAQAGYQRAFWRACETGEWP